MTVQETPTMSDALRRAIFDADDLRYLQRLLDEMLADLGDRNVLIAGPLGKDEIQVRLAAALFDCARPGRRDDLRLKRLALEKVAASASRPR